MPPHPSFARDRMFLPLCPLSSCAGLFVAEGKKAGMGSPLEEDTDMVAVYQDMARDDLLRQ